MTGAYLLMVQVIVSYLQRWLLGTHKGAVLPRHLPTYLNEFTFRFNRRYRRGPAFHRALGLIIHTEKWTAYDALYGVAKSNVSAWIHPNLPAYGHPKTAADGDKAFTLPVGVA